jgi:hypothetical protein
LHKGWPKAAHGSGGLGGTGCRPSGQYEESHGIAASQYLISSLFYILYYMHPLSSLCYAQNHGKNAGQFIFFLFAFIFLLSYNEK